MKHAMAQAGCALCMAVVSVAAPAQIGVGSSGQASFGLSITVPPGIAGMAPNLSLAYTDGGINGPLGVGWSLQGVSMITRCPATKAVDDMANSVEFSGSDKLCLDGQRLIQTDAGGVPLGVQADDAKGLPGTAVREYRTEKDSFARVRAYGQISTNAADGPAYFRVWTKSGQVYEYGRDPAVDTDTNAVITVQGRKTAMVWAVRRIKDVLGNYISFSYRQRDVAWGSGSAAGGATGKEWNLGEIRYTGTSAALPGNKVVLDYEDRPTSASPGHDRSEAYQVGNKNVSIERLRAIRAYVNANGTAVLVRTYKLSYERGVVTGRSRLRSVQECVGAAETACLPPTKFTYTDPSSGTLTYAANANFALDDLTSLGMTDPAGGLGILTGDFNGDGLTDILRWSTNVADNKLYLSKGDGRFTATAHNLVSAGDRLFSTDGCLASTTADFDGDGLTDVLRTAKPGCSAGSVLYLSRGDGNFTKVALNPDINLTMRKVQTQTQTQTSTSCLPAVAPGPGSAATCIITSQSTGNRYYLLDANADGFLDIVTTVAPGFQWNSVLGPTPSDSAICSGMLDAAGKVYTEPCTRVFLGSANGEFKELATTNVRKSSLYSDPPSPMPSNPYWRRTDQADVNGDGLQDILALRTGNWLSLGNGNFAVGQTEDYAQLCPLPVDFNGDARVDCLSVSPTPASQNLTISLGTTSSIVAQFNLTAAGDNLLAFDEYQRQTVGVVIDDFDGDGRQDLLRWGPLATDHGIYLSNGDGSFRPRDTAGLGSLGRPLQAADGSASFVLGDFLGSGSVQILHLKQNPPATGGDAKTLNQLFERTRTRIPVDLLDTVTLPTGLVHAVKARQALTAGNGRYTSDRGTDDAAKGKQVDLRPPMYVVVTTSTDTGAGTLDTEYAYKGLKAERAGRGLLGFREMREQRPAPDGSFLTTASRYVQVHPFIGVTSLVKTYKGSWSGPDDSWISRTTNAYCDKTSTAVPPDAAPGSPPVPCPTSAKVQRPYLYQVIEEGRDLATGSALPTITTTHGYNDWGDPSSIKVVTKGTALAEQLAQTFTRLTENTYFAPATDGDNWVLGRLKTAKVTNTVPDSMSRIPAVPGTANFASDTKGSGARPPPSPLPPALQGTILQLLLDN